MNNDLVNIINGEILEEIDFILNFQTMGKKRRKKPDKFEN